MQSGGRDSSAASNTGALARRLFHKSFKLLSSHTYIPPHKGTVSHLADTEKPLKKISFPSYLFTALSPRPHTTPPPFIRQKKVLTSRIWARCDCFIYRQRRRQGRGLASRRINLPGITNKSVDDLATSDKQMETLM